MIDFFNNQLVEKELGKIRKINESTLPIPKSEYLQRINKLCSFMEDSLVEAIYLNASKNLTYFTSLVIEPSERLSGAIISHTGQVAYIMPSFEKKRFDLEKVIDGELKTWEEHEDPTKLILNIITGWGIKKGTIAFDEETPFSILSAVFLNNESHSHNLVNASKLTKHCRIIKSHNEILLIKKAMQITSRVQHHVLNILHEGIDTRQVEHFISIAHKKLGADNIPGFSIVLFGEATAYPHGTGKPQILSKGDAVLIDTGATVNGYYSDITKSYMFGNVSKKYRSIWELERNTQLTVFENARLGTKCETLDLSARVFLEAHGLGPEYKTPGLPHRTGHGLGLNVHEHPYIVKGNNEELKTGMCFSNEPTICIDDKFGVRLEDHIFMTGEGPEWFTEPPKSYDQQFGQK